LGGDLGFSADAGAKIFGGWSRGFEQKSLSIFFRSQYGTNVLDYPLFEDRPYEEYEAFVLRNSGNDWTSTMMRDLTLTGLMKNSHVDIQAGRPSIVYLNGDYWGIYNIREKINEHYLAALHDIPTEDITILEKDSKVIFGDNTEYISLIEQANKLDLTIPENYDSVANQIDLANYIQYHIAQIYINNTDWPGNNNKFWKAKNGKWRWILFDTDFGFSIWSNNDHFRNTLAFALNPAGPPWPNPPWSTLLFRRLMTNQQFMERFINTFADEINTRFLPDSVIEQIEKKEEAIRFEIPQQIKQWSAFSMLGWRDRVDVMKTFASQRPMQMRGYIQSYFGLPSQRTVQVKIENPTHGSVQLNTIQLTEADWEGIYFESVPITLTALPKAGFLFERWSGSLTSTETTITIDPTQPLTLTAHFTRVDSEVLETDIIINEINYNSNEEQDAGDWIELHNRGSVPQNISDWVFKDGNDEHNFVLPQGTVLPTNGYLVLTSNTDKFKQQFPAVQNQIGDFDFKLSSEGELVRLYNRDSILIDSIRYAPTDGWPEEANGLGPTLELLHPDSDNAQRDSWTTYAFTGTPGAENGVYITSTTEYLNTLAVEVYPNPFSDNLIFNVSLPSTAPITLQVMNLTGQVVLRQVDVWLSPNQSYPVNMTTFPKGAYWINRRPSTDCRPPLKNGKTI